MHRGASGSARTATERFLDAFEAVFDRDCWRTAWFGTTMMTEVWVEKIDKGHSDGAFATMLCGLIMHELMHQKLDTHPEDRDKSDIHSWLEPSYGHTPVTRQSRLTDTDAKVIAVALPKKYPQRKV
jgi:hypothetical protein